MADLAATFDNAFTQIQDYNASASEFREKQSAETMKFSAEMSAMDHLDAITERLASSVETLSRNIAN